MRRSPSWSSAWLGSSDEWPSRSSLRSTEERSGGLGSGGPDGGAVLARRDPRERLGLAVAATLGYGSESALYFAALNHGSAATVTLLFYVYPVWVMLTAIALDRRVPAGMLIAALVFAI